MEAPASDVYARRLAMALSLSGFASSLLMTSMVGTQLLTGISPVFFASGHSLGAIVDTLTGDPSAAQGLRIAIALNAGFIASYVSFFTLLAARFRPALGSWVAGIALGALLGTALLDVAGTQHVSAMLHAIEHQLPVAVWEPQLEAVIAGMRFHCTYVGCALFGLGFLNEGRLGRACAVVLWLGYIPFGSALVAYPLERVPDLVLLRYVFFAVSFFVSGVLFSRARGGLPGPSADPAH